MIGPRWVELWLSGQLGGIYVKRVSEFADGAGLRFPLIALDANYRRGRQSAPFGELDLCHGAAHPPPFELFADQDHDLHFSYLSDGTLPFY